MKPHARRLFPVLFRLAAALLLFLAGFLLRGWFLPSPPPAEPVDPESAEAPTRATQMYTCSMHPQVRSPDPDDKCPICFMDLIPVPMDDDEDEDEADMPRLRVSERAAALMEIRTWPAERRPVEIEIRLFGRVDFDETRLFDVVARTEAYIERLFVSAPWQSVARGDVVAELYSPAVVTTMRELLVAREGQDGILEATRARLQRMGVTPEQIDEVLAAGEAPRTFRVVSPADGAALTVAVREGEWLREGGQLTRIADLSRVWINLEAYERDLAWIETGLPAVFAIGGLPGQSFEGTVAFIDPVLNDRTRTVRLRVEADNPDGTLRPGMFASARVLASYPPGTTPSSLHPQPSTPHPPLVIPVSAPLITGRRTLVYVRLPDADRPTFEARDITLGPRAGDVYVVEDGLDEGDLVVVHGAFKIDSELQIRGRPSMMAAEGDAPPGHRHHEQPTDAEARDDADLRLQTHCPVMDLPINRDHYHDHDGQRIYVCCPGCLDEVRERAEEIVREHRARGIVFERVEG